ncbi:MAG: hypothetical protein A4E64_02376 [Syntrophorhabdus sp. PtaU1.Bin058]|nr:MAG: hypothetical protein A4E64_02376 [Syntrophorhabdus sp. PtaU1.Bin058]
MGTSIHHTFRLTTFIIILILLACTKTVAGPSLPIRSLQAVVVLTGSWDSADATIQLFERESAHAPWRAVNEPSAAVVGRNGLGWGIGLHDTPSPDTVPLKEEGDGKAPAGIFPLSFAFGYAPPDAARWIHLPYRHVTPSLQCVDDVDSEFYNQVIDTSHTPIRWGSHEEMLRKDGLYKMGIFVGHNVHPPIPGRGSCIFIHIRRAQSQGTAGCTAMAESYLQAILRWLDPAGNPVLVQLPRSEYERYRRVWNLP